MRGMLGTRGRSMTQVVEGFSDIAGHGYVYMPGRIVPIQMESKVAVASPIFGDGVLGG